MPLFRYKGMFLLLLRGVWNYSHTIVDNFNSLPTFAVYFLGLVNDYLLYKLSHDFRREFCYFGVPLYKSHKFSYIIRFFFGCRKFLA